MAAARAPPAQHADEVWKKGARASTGALAAVPWQAKPNLKTLEAELQRQLVHVHSQVQQDLDLLHEQVHAEVHAAITKELHGVARRIAEVAQGAEAWRGEVEPMKGALQKLSQEADLSRRKLEADMIDARDTVEAIRQAASQAAAAAPGEASAAVDREAAALRAEIFALKEQFAQELVERSKELRDAQAEAQASQQRALEEAVGSQMRWLEELTQEAAKVKGEVDEEREAREALAARLDGHAETLEGRIETALVAAQEAAAAGGSARSEAARSDAAEASIAANRASLAELAEALRGEAAVGEARFQEVQAAMAGLEERLADSLREALDAAAERAEGQQQRLRGTLGDDLQERLRSLTGDVKDKIVALDARVERLDAECTEGLDFASASLARSVEWRAEVDVARLEGAGKLSLESPPFAAAGLRDLRLHLRLQSQGGGRGGEPGAQRWACGLFLRGAQGQVSFRLHVAGRSQTFAGDFAEAAEWGSQRVAVIDRLEPVLPVRLELLDVTAPVHARRTLPAALSATLHITDAAQLASREVAGLRSSLVRRVEWRIARVAERLATARAAAGSLDEDAAFEPICSPPFAAGGVEGLQLQLYPLGYRAPLSRGDESCGFFLVCPCGVSVRCRAFVGDASRTFDHYYGTREPYGRGSFCRIADKVAEDDTITCGIELLEISQEQTMQVRNGPFGSVMDQLKVVAGPAGGGMEQVRELRESPPVGGSQRGDPSLPGRPRVGRLRPGAAPVALESHRLAPAAMARPSAAQLAVSKSLPVLLPAVGGGQGPGVASYTAGTPSRRHADLTLIN